MTFERDKSFWLFTSLRCSWKLLSLDWSISAIFYWILTILVQRSSCSWNNFPTVVSYPPKFRRFVPKLEWFVPSLFRSLKSIHLHPTSTRFLSFWKRILFTDSWYTGNVHFVPRFARYCEKVWVHEQWVIGLCVCVCVGDFFEARVRVI